VSYAVQIRRQECLIRLQSLRQVFHQAGSEDLLARAWRVEAVLYGIRLEDRPEESLARLEEVSRAIERLATCR